MYNLWTRNTIPWSLQCEQDGFTRLLAVDKLESLAPAMNVTMTHVRDAKQGRQFMMTIVSMIGLITFANPIGVPLCFSAQLQPSRVFPGCHGFILITGLVLLLSFLLIIYVGRLREMDNQVKESLVNLGIFNGCSDEQTRVPTEILDN